MSKGLKFKTILRIASAVANDLNLKIPESEEILSHISLSIPIPVIIKNDLYQMWIDKYYIAYSKLTEKEIHYVYVNKHHITEEYKSYSDARRDRRNNVHLPAGIRASFSLALRCMRAKGKDYFVIKKYSNF